MNWLASYGYGFLGQGLFFSVFCQWLYSEKHKKKRNTPYLSGISA